MDPTKMIQQQYLDPYRQPQMQGMQGMGGVFANGTPTFGAYQQNPFSNVANLMPGGMQSGARSVTPRSGLEGYQQQPSMMNTIIPRNVPALDGLGEFRKNPMMMHQNSRAEDGAAMLGNKFLAGNAGIGPDGGMSKWGSAAAKGLSNAKTFFGAMKPGSGSTVANAFGKSSLGKAGGFMSKVGALPGWSMPAAAAAGWQINKRLGQKAHQKDLARYQDQIKNTPTDQQHTLGPAPTHNRNAGLLGRLFRR